MALQIRGSSQILDNSINLEKIKDLSAGVILGRAEDAAEAAPAELSGEDIRKIAGLHTEDNVHFAALEADAITAASANLGAGALIAGTATLSGDMNAQGAVTGASSDMVGLAKSGSLESGAATLASANIAGALNAGASTMASATVNGALIAGASTLASATISNAASVGSTLTVTGKITGADEAEFSGALSAGAATLASATVNGNVSATGTLHADGALSAASADFGAGSLDAGAATLASATVNGLLSADSFASAAVSITGGSIDNTAIGASGAASGAFTSLSASGDLTVAGNLTVNGDLTYVNTETLKVQDPMIHLGEGNAADIQDLGFVGSYDAGASFAGMVRDADDAKFKLFSTSEDLSSATAVDFATASKGTLVAHVEGDIAYDNAVTFSLSGDVAGSASFSGNNSPDIAVTIQDDSVQLSNIDFFIDEDNMASDSASHVPSQQSVKAYVDAQVSSGGLSGLSAQDIQMVDSSGSFVAAHEEIQYAVVDASIAAANMVSLSENYVDEFKSMMMVFLNGQKLRYGIDFSLANSNELSIAGDIIEIDDALEIRHYVKS